MIRKSRSVRVLAELIAENAAAGKIKAQLSAKITMYLDSSKLRSLSRKADVDVEVAYKRFAQYIQGE